MLWMYIRKVYPGYVLAVCGRFCRFCCVRFIAIKYLLLFLGKRKVNVFVYYRIVVGF